MHATSSSSLELLQAAYPGKIALSTADVANVCNLTPASIRTLRCRGAFQIPSSSNGGRHSYDIRDVAYFLDSRRTPKPKRGAPSKAVRIAKKAGV